jgi:predicted O-methyltransferase YrrM
MTDRRWTDTSAYMCEVFGWEDEQLATLMPRAIEAGLPDIAVTAEVGKLLMLMSSMAGPSGGSSPGGAQLALELGTLAGYSGIWIARGMHPEGRLITVEPNETHADFARREFDRAGLPDPSVIDGPARSVEIRRTTALEALPALLDEFGPRSFDLIYADAIKSEYPAYFERGRELVRPGGLFLADNVLGSSWWITEPDEDPERETSRRAVDRFNRMVADDPEFEACCAPVRNGILIGRRMSA